MNINLELIKKYDRPGPRYTSYPPATFFNSGFTADTYKEFLVSSNEHGAPDISFYFHVPFCPQLCHFCGCNTQAMPAGTLVEQYFEAVLNEFRTVSKYLYKSRRVSQVHWGGGTPNSVSFRYIGKIMDAVTHNFTVAPGAEIAMECNPAYLSYPAIDELSAMGFNRLSLGIQDFDAGVLNLINRKPSGIEPENLVEYIRAKNMDVNLDFVYGLPGQTDESFASTIGRAIKLSPQRLVTFSYAHVPWFKQAQKILEQYPIPNADDKLRMFLKAYGLLTQNDYIAIGLDHFAQATDGLAIALRDKTLHRNFMGYCTREHTGQVYAFGATGISQLEDAYSQNIKSTQEYVKTALENGFAIEKGYALSSGDMVCRAVIGEIMCNQYVDFGTMAGRFDMPVAELLEVTGFDPEKIKLFISDGLAVFDGNILSIPEEGRFFLRNIAMLFDPLLTGTETNYSKTV
jgi:oxygen-independent coproporphyrinogen III oxidase